MCTLTFIPHTRGFILGMNRDDLYSRPPALAPAACRAGGQLAIYPLEPGSGTWIAANQAGLGFAILNWSLAPGSKLHSRGEIIPRLAACRNLEMAAEELRATDLAGTLPFRLLLFSAEEETIRECQWDGASLSFNLCAWQLAHWFSSGRGDAMAARARRPVCQAADASPEAGSVAWLRRLHQSHQPEQGAFSICVHREDAGSLSYTQVECDAARISVGYSPGYPCQSAGVAVVTLPRLRP